MKDIDEYGLKLCAYQADIFRKSASDQECSSGIFVRRFMNSELAERMDRKGSFFESSSVSGAFEELNRQYGKSSYGKIKYGAEELYWIGYIYRYWSYISDSSSKHLYKVIKPDELRRLYLPYHSLDPKQAIERIMETEKENEKTDIARGVAILRMVRRRRTISGN